MKIYRNSNLVSAIGFLMLALVVLLGTLTAAAQEKSDAPAHQGQNNRATRPRIVSLPATVKSVQITPTAPAGEPQLQIRFPRRKSAPVGKIAFDRYARAIYLSGSAETLGIQRIVSFNLPPLLRRH